MQRKTYSTLSASERRSWCGSIENYANCPTRTALAFEGLRNKDLLYRAGWPSLSDYVACEHRAIERGEREPPEGLLSSEQRGELDRKQGRVPTQLDLLEHEWEANRKLLAKAGWRLDEWLAAQQRDIKAGLREPPVDRSGREPAQPSDQELQSPGLQQPRSLSTQPRRTTTMDVASNDGDLLVDVVRELFPRP